MKCRGKTPTIKSSFMASGLLLLSLPTRLFLRIYLTHVAISFPKEELRNLLLLSSPKIPPSPPPSSSSLAVSAPIFSSHHTGCAWVVVVVVVCVAAAAAAARVRAGSEIIGANETSRCSSSTPSEFTSIFAESVQCARRCEKCTYFHRLYIRRFSESFRAKTIMISFRMATSSSSSSSSTAAADNARGRRDSENVIVEYVELDDFLMEHNRHGSNAVAVATASNEEGEEEGMEAGRVGEAAASTKQKQGTTMC